MWEPRHLTTLWAFMVCYKDSFTLNFFFAKTFMWFLIGLAFSGRIGTDCYFLTSGLGKFLPVFTSTFILGSECNRIVFVSGLYGLGDSPIALFCFV
jgi:hypothetical protein